jgi:hypothetical protein
MPSLRWSHERNAVDVDPHGDVVEHDLDERLQFSLQGPV